MHGTSWLIRLFLLVALTFIRPIYLIAQDEDGSADFVETEITLNVPQVGGREMEAIFFEEDIYLPVSEVFTFLRIQNRLSAGMDSVVGHFMSEADSYLIDYKEKIIKYRDKTYPLQSQDLIRRENNLFLKTPFFGSIFGLECKFDFRYMRVNLIPKMELPAVKEMRLEFMRSNLRNLKGEVKSDTVIGRSYPFFHFGNADWAIIATQRVPGVNEVRVGLGLGAIVLGGEANVLLNYTNTGPFKEDQQIYHWHFANNNRKYLRQVILGKIPHGAYSTVYSPVVGAVLTNTPTTYRRSFGNYTLSDYTEPNWTVELYVNSVLVDYTKADASGFFLFEVPMVYGNSTIKLKFYGPWGEERSKEKTISVPYTFLPKRTLEYNIAGGFLEDSAMNRFGKAQINYGVSPILTLGTGVEYNSAIHPGSTMPFVRFALRAASSLLITGDYLFGVRFKGMLNYRTRNNLQIELGYIKYHPQQLAITNSYLEERRLVATYPINRRKMSMLMRLTLNNSVAFANQFVNSEFLISANFQGVNGNLTTNLTSTNYQSPYVYSTASVGIKLPKGYLVTPQAQFDYNNTRFVMAKVEVEKHFWSHATARLLYELNFWSHMQSVQLGFRYDFSFAQVGVSARYAPNSSTFIQSAKGSLIFDAKNHYVGATNRTNLGKGGLIIIPFFDINGNGKFDKGEPKTPGLNFKMMGGRIEPNKKDSTYRIFELEAFAEYFIEIERSSFDNIAWQIENHIISVYIDPNCFKRVEVPVAILSEASGMVYFDNNTELVGQQRITIQFFNEQGQFVGETLSEIDGYYSLLAFTPGKYYAQISSDQLEKLQWKSFPDKIPFEVIQKSDGVMIEGLDFVLHPIKKSQQFNQPQK